MKKNRIVSPLNSGLTGRDHYASKYANSLERQAEWLRRGAKQKADSICKLLNQNGLKPSTVLEVGCGTGAVIAELQRRGVAEAYYAVDYSTEAIAFVKETLPDVYSVAGDIMKMDCTELFGEPKFDLVICSHVLEHLESPAQFLESLLDFNWGNFLAEVPLENLIFGRIKGAFMDRSKHPAGHVQFFNRLDFSRLLSRAGLDIVDEYVYAPFFSKEAIKFVYGDCGQLKYFAKMCTEHYLPKHYSMLWSKLYHAHMAVLCR